MRDSDGGGPQVCVAMTRELLRQALIESYHAFNNDLRQMPSASLHRAPEGKWTPAQQLEHLIKSVQPVTFALSLPKFLLGLVIGKANRPSRSYDDLVARYKSKLAAGGKAPKAFVPGTPADIAAAYGQLEKTVAMLCHRMNRFSEKELEEYILPHPLLGKLTLREMLYFTNYHAQHHRQLVIQYTAMLTPPSS